MSAVNMSALDKFLVKKEINFQQALFVFVDTTNVDSGEKRA